VSAAAGHAVLDVMTEEKLQERAAELGRHLRGRLTQELASNPRVGSIRGTGLFVGVSFVDPWNGRNSGLTAKRVVEDMKKRHVLISRVGRDDEVLKIRPPLAFEREHADILLDKLFASIGGL
jgi:4-aminobutyrate aminotransferase-like enzyme